jgi:pimeloyl-ACP methyl ester carboxylesterase
MAHAEIVRVDGVDLSVRRSGTGRVVVCLSAIAQGSEDFDPLVAQLGDRFSFVRIDWPQHGLSGADNVPPSAERYAALLAGALDALSIEHPIIIGNSIGGAVAILHASRHPVAGLVLCDSGGLVDVTPTIARLCRTMARFFCAGARKAWWFGRAYALYYRFVLPAGPARERRRAIIAEGYRMAGILAAAWESFGQKSADIRSLAAALDMPVLVAWARRDRVIPLAYCLPAIKTLKHGTLKTYPGGHSAFLEAPDAFAADFAAFAAGLDRSEGDGEIADHADETKAA